MIFAWTLRTSCRAAGLLLLFAAMATALVGCGPTLTKVNGKVAADGKPVTAGILIFAPVGDGNNAPGAPISINVKEDGTYETAVAIVGKNIVSYNAPPANYPEGYVPKASEPAPQSPFAGLIPEKKDIEIKPGDNTIDISLIRLKELPKMP